MIIVNFGGGTNSTGLLVGALERGLRPDIVVFSDTGSEMPHTYEHLDAVSAWLVSKGLAPIQVTRWVRKDGRFIALHDYCLEREELPSKAYGFSGSSGTGPTTRDGMYAYRIVLKSPRWRERTRFNPGSSHIPTVPFSSFAGSIVACAYNLNQCRPGKESKPGEACWSVRAAPEGIETVEEAVDYFSKKGSTGAHVTAYTEGVLLRDVGFSVHDPVLRRVQKQGAKDVFAFAVGRAVSTSSKTVKVPKVWHAVQFSPLLPPKGRGERVFHVQGEPVEHVDWFMGEGRKAVANVGRRNPDDLLPRRASC